MSAVSLYGKMLAFSRLKIHQADIEAILADTPTQDGKGVPVIVESELDLPLKALIDGLWDKGVAVIGVVDGVLNEQAKELKLATFPSDGKRITRLDDKKLEAKAGNAASPADKADQTADKPSAEPNAEQSAEPKTESNLEQTQETGTDKEVGGEAVAVTGTQNPISPKQEPMQGVSAFVHTQMVRSGQVLHHMGGDLIITAPVNNGSEVATDYNLHIYGKAQGRLVAGATGDENARIFCQQFDPSLVSVAGTYCLKDDIPAEMINQAVQVSFWEGKLIFKRMS